MRENHPVTQREYDYPATELLMSTTVQCCANEKASALYAQGLKAPPSGTSTRCSVRPVIVKINSVI